MRKHLSRIPMKKMRLLIFIFSPHGWQLFLENSFRKITGNQTAALLLHFTTEKNHTMKVLKYNRASKLCHTLCNTHHPCGVLFSALLVANCTHTESNTPDSRTSSQTEPAVSTYCSGVGLSLRAGHPCAIASPASCPAQEGELPILILQNDLPKAKQGGEEGVPPTSPAHHPANLRGINANRCSRCASGPERTANTCPSTPIPT